MSLAISIIAVLISITSLVFTFRQYKNNQLVKKLEKSNEVLKHSYELRKSSQDLRDKINMTDDIDDYNPLLDVLDACIETQLSFFVNDDEVTTSDIYKVEKKLLRLDLEFELLVKQINEAIRFNKEVNEFEKTANK